MTIRIEWILYAILGLITVFSLMRGYIQGLRRSLYGFCCSLVFWGIFWVTAPLLFSKSMILENRGLYALLSKFLSKILGNTEGVGTLLQLIIRLLSEKFGIDPKTLESPVFGDALAAILQFVLKILYLFVLWVVFEIVKTVIYHVIVKNIDPTENKKHPLGMYVGFLRAAVCFLLILSMFNSFFLLLPPVGQPAEEEYDTTSLYDFILSYAGEANKAVAEKAVASIRSYQSSKLLNLTGVRIFGKRADDVFVDSILSGRSGDYSFAIREELQLVVQIAEYTCDMTDGFQIQNVNWTALNERQVADVQRILHCLSDEQLLNRLGTVLVGAAISMDAVRQVLPVSLQVEEYNSIDFKKELVNIAVLVEQVYALGDLANLDYFAMDAEQVRKVITALADLETINLLGHIGVSYGIRSLAAGNDEYAGILDDLEVSLATLALSDSFSKDLSGYAGLYASFIDLYSEKVLDSYKDENGKITNYLAALTATDAEKQQGIVSTVLEANFVGEILPKVLTILREKLVPEPFVSLVNPGVVTSTAWESEINSLLQILADVTTDAEKVRHPFESIGQYDFSLLSGFSVETVVGSELLSFASIRCLIQASEGEGLLAASGDFGKSISIPDALKTDAAEIDGKWKFADAWYGDAGELSVMFRTLKNVAANIESVDSIEASLPQMLGAIDAEEILSGDVLYATAESLLQEYAGSLLTVPLNTLTLSVGKDEVSPLLFDGVQKEMIARSELKKIIAAVSDRNVLDLDLLYRYYEKNADGTVSDTPTAESDRSENAEYEKRLDYSAENVISVLTADSLLRIDENTGEREGLNKLFASDILRASLTRMMEEQGGDYICIPKNAVEEAVEVRVTDSAGEKTVQTLNPVSKHQLSALLVAIKELDIDAVNFVKTPVEIVKNLSVYDENGVFVDLKEATVTVFGGGADGKENPDYSGILHATFSKYLLDFSAGETSGLALVIPTEKIEDEDGPGEDYPKLIESGETLDLMRTVSVIGTDVFIESTQTQTELMTKILDRVGTDSRSLQSAILRATVTDYLVREAPAVKIPVTALQEDLSESVITFEEMNALIKVVGDLFRNDAGNLNISGISLGDLYANRASVSASVILRNTVTEKIAGIENVVISVEDLDTVGMAVGEQYLQAGEVENLLATVNFLFGENATVDTIQVNDLTVENMKNAKENGGLASAVFNATIRQTLPDSLSIPQMVLVAHGNRMVLATDPQPPQTVYLVQQEELNALVDSLYALFHEDGAPADASVVNLDAGGLTCEKLKNSFETSWKDSLIVNATLTEKMYGNLLIPLLSDAVRFDGDSVIWAEKTEGGITTFSPILTQTEMRYITNSLVTLFGDVSISGLNTDGLQCSSLFGAMEDVRVSWVLRATITEKMMGNMVIPAWSEAVEYANGNPILVGDSSSPIMTETETENLIRAMDALFGDRPLTEINATSMTLPGETVRAKALASNIIRATVTKQMNNEQTGEALYVTADADCVYCCAEIKAGTPETVAILTEGELSAFFRVLDLKGGEDNLQMQSFSLDGLSAMDSDTVSEILKSNIVRYRICDLIPNGKTNENVIRLSDATATVYPALSADEISEYLAMYAMSH